MTPRAGSLTVLRLVLGTVLVILAIATLLRPSTDPHPAHLVLVIRAIALAEIAGGLLLLVPRTMRLGAVVLLAVFTVAVAIHFLHGEWNVGPLVVYGAAAQVFLERGAIEARS